MNGKMFFGKNNNNSRNSSINGFNFNFEFPTINLANLGTNLNPNRISSSLSNLLTHNNNRDNNSEMFCEGCGTKLHFLKKKKTCSECCMDYCASCFPRDLNDCSSLRRNKCRKCRIFSMNPLDRNALMSLRVKDLKWFLNKSKIYTNYCKEKSELVDLIIQNNGSQTSLRNNNPFVYDFNQSSSNHHDSSINTSFNNINTDSNSRFYYSTNRLNNLNNLETNNSSLNEASQSSTYDSLLLERQESFNDKKEISKFSNSNTNSDFKLFNINDLKTEDEILNLSVRQIKLLLTRNFVDYKGCCEKEELFKKVLHLWRTVNQNKAKDELDDSNACKICMERAADCVLLECGHVVTCIECGKKMNECPICRQYVVRVLRIYKS